MNKVYTSGLSPAENFINQAKSYRIMKEFDCFTSDLLMYIVNKSFITDQDVQCHREINIAYDPNGLDWHPHEVNGEPRYSEVSSRTECFKICNYLSAHHKTDYFKKKAFCDPAKLEQWNRMVMDATIRNFNSRMIQEALAMIQATIDARNIVGSDSNPVTVKSEEINIFVEAMIQAIREKGEFCSPSDLVLVAPTQMRSALLTNNKWTQCDVSCNSTVPFISGSIFETINGVKLITTDWLQPVRVPGSPTPDGMVDLPIMLINRNRIAWYGEITDEIKVDMGTSHNDPTAETIHLYATYGGFNLRPAAHAMAYVRMESPFAGLLA